MQTNYEIALGEFMPAFRAKVAKLMVNKYGISQQKTAGLLEITQASISKYVNDHYSKIVEGIQAEINDDAADAFIKEVVVNHERAAQRHMCKACQRYHKFDCVIMVK